MQGNRKKSYQSYKFKNRNELQEVFQKSYQTLDRHYQLKMMNPIVQYLDQNGIHEYEDFILLLKNNGFRSCDIHKLIDDFQVYINASKSINNKINWIKHRELQKSNAGEKNIILNRLAIEFPNEILFFTNDYLIRNFPSKTNKNTFIQEFRSKIEHLNNTRQIKAFLKHFE